MGENDDGETERASLEMPSLRGLLRRKKGKRAAGGPDEPGSTADVDEPRAASGPGSAPVPETAPETAPQPEAAPVPEAAPEPAQHADQELEDTSPTTILDEQPAPTQAPLFADEAPPAGQSHAVPASPVDGDRDPSEDTTAGARTGKRERRRPTLPAIPARAAAMVTGVVIGLLAVGATYLAIEGCEAVRGTSSCGGPGLFVVLAILAVLVFLGGAMLRAFRVSDSVSTSLLAVGLIAVVALLFLIEVIFSPWMWLVIPLVSLGTFTLSHWVTSTFVDMD